MGVRSFACSKVALSLLNVLYLMVACVLIVVAAYFRAVTLIDMVTLTGGLVVCGVLLMLIAIIGLVGAICHHQVMLFFYMILLFILFLVQFALACTCLALSTVQQRQILKLGWSKASPELKQKMQMEFGCCGFDNDSAYLPLGDESNMGHPECSHTQCCHASKRQTTHNNSTAAVSSTSSQCQCPPCLSRAKPHLEEVVKTLGALGLVFSLSELFGVWLTIKYRNLKDPKANPSAFL